MSTAVILIRGDGAWIRVAIEFGKQVIRLGNSRTL